MRIANDVVIAGKRKWYSRAAKSLVVETGVTDPVAAMANKVTELIVQTGITEPPFNPRITASFAGVTDVVEADMTEAAELIPFPKMLIRLNSSDPQGRKNFSCAHEVAHLLVPSYWEHPVRKIDVHTGTFADDREEEMLCDVGAQEILMPTEPFCKRAARYGVGIGSVKQLAEDFQASLEATCIKISGTGVYGCTALVPELGIKPSQKVPEGQVALPGMESIEPGRRLRVKYPAYLSIGGRKLFFPRYRHIDEDSPLFGLCLNGGTFRGVCTLPAGRGEREFGVEAEAFPFTGPTGEVENKVLCLVAGRPA